MASEFLGLRLNDKKHKDIIDWLDKFEDRSEETRRLMSLAIRISQGEYQIEKQELKPISWNIPKEPTIKEKKVEGNTLVMNILGSFGE